MAIMKELIILVGMQGCGKTHYCRTVLPNYSRVSQDEGPKYFEGIVRHLEQLLETGTEQIVIDRINPLRWQRERFSDFAKKHGYKVKIIYLEVPRKTCEQRILQRKDHPTLGPEKMKEALSRFATILEKPTEDECDELVIVRDFSGTA